MRKQRVIIFEDDITILMLMKRFFEERGYETVTFPEPLVCPVYGEDVKSCENLDPCADLIITDFNMPRMTGLELLRRQKERNCRLDIRNKALVSGNIAEEEEEAAAMLGCRVFKKPFRLAEISSWLKECETRMDLSRPLAMKRDNNRIPCFKVVTCSGGDGRDGKAIAVNMSPTGICLKVNTPLSKDQIVNLHLDVPPTRRRAAVRWIRKLEEGFYEAGFVYC